MTYLALILILVSSTLHASWNLLAKKAKGGLAFTWLFGALSVVVYTPMALFIYRTQSPKLDVTALLFVFGSAMLHIGYLALLQYAYRIGDMSLVYPVARGSSPALTTWVAVGFLGERITPLAGLGIALIVASTFVFTGLRARSASSNLHVIIYGLLTGVFIASYTLWDNFAVSKLLIPPLVYDWACNLVRTALLSVIMFSQTMRGQLRHSWLNSRKEAWGIALLSPLAYILVLTAMTFTQVSYIAPAREISILIGTVMGARYFAEGQSRRRLVGALTMVLGVVLLALN